MKLSRASIDIRGPEEGSTECRYSVQMTQVADDGEIISRSFTGTSEGEGQVITDAVAKFQDITAELS